MRVFTRSSLASELAELSVELVGRPALNVAPPLLVHVWGRCAFVPWQRRPGFWLKVPFKLRACSIVTRNEAPRLQG